MSKPKIVGIYRVKNEARFIEQSIKSVVDLCSEIIVLDDNSSITLLKFVLALIKSQI